MQETNIVIADVIQIWKELCAYIKKHKKLKIDAFYEAFSKTYQLLSQHLTEESLSKELVLLVTEASLFANIKDDTLDSTCHAAFVLTERMLSYCAFSAVEQPKETVPVYVVEARKDVQLPLGDVEESLTTLNRILDDFYWKQIANG